MNGHDLKRAERDVVENAFGKRARDPDRQQHDGLVARRLPSLMASPISLTRPR